MDRAGKQAVKVVIGERLKKANAIILAEYRGLRVEDLTNLRVELRKANAEFRVSKNRLLKRAIKEDALDYDELTSNLKGPLGTVYCYGDIAQTAKALLKFKGERELFLIRGGILDGEVFDESKLKALSELPSKEVLLGNMLGSMMAPHRGLVTVLSGVHRNLVQVLAAIRDRKQG